MRISPGPKVQSDDEFLAAATERGTTTFHPGCTCRMGPADAKWAVVDDQLRVHGLQGLRVVDASIMPRMISANLNASTLMIADKSLFLPPTPHHHFHPLTSCRRIPNGPWSTTSCACTGCRGCA